MNTATANYLNALASEVSILRTLAHREDECAEFRHRKKKTPDHIRNSRYHVRVESQRRMEITEKARDQFLYEKQYWQLQGLSIP